jgi:putative tricarboxylic transport membrane protein
MDLVVLYAIGAVGLVMRIFDFPLAPVVIGIILGPIMEQEFRRAMSLSQGDPAIFFSSWISGGLFVLAALILAGPVVVEVLKRVRKAQPEGGDA